jgi:predicted SnoaL-like aldol condensation-catalyzing enzyme
MSLKEKARAYIAAVNAQDESLVARMVDENYIQHNPLVPTGRAAFLAFLPDLKRHGAKITNLRMLEDGRYIIMQHRWDHALPFGSECMEAFHIIRFDAGDLIAEHWSVMRTESAGRSFSKGPREITDRSKTAQNKAYVAELIQQAFPLSRLHRVFGEGNFVLAISEDLQSRRARYDLFRLENFEISHRWELSQAIPIENFKNSNTMFGFEGPV